MLELSLHVLDIVENSTRAGATKVTIEISEDTKADLLTLKIQDNGSGMSEEILKKVTDPFFTTKKVREVGLGLPLLAQASAAAGGKLTIDSALGVGTTVKAIFKLSHIDRQPLGDMAGTMVTLVAGNRDITFVYHHRHNDKEFILDTGDVKRELEDIPINHPRVLAFIKEQIVEGLKEIGAVA